MTRTISNSFRRMFAAGCIAATGMLASTTAHASLIPLGALIYDVTSTTTAEFDIENFTGPNSFPPDFPVLTSVNLSSLHLIVDFSDGSSHTFTQADFTLSLDGLSYDGPTIAIGGTVRPSDATLTGLLSPTTIDDGSIETVDSSLVPTILTDPSGGRLTDGDFAIINASTGGSVPVPEPDGFLVVAAGLLGVIALRRRGSADVLRRLFAASRSGLAALLLVLPALLLWPGAASAQTVKLATAASPFTGVAGVNSVNVTASSLPAGTLPGDVHIALAPTCAAGASGPVAGEIDTVATKITSIGAVKRIQFLIPGTAAQATYLVSISGPGFTSSDCAALNVTHSSVVLNACLPTSSLAVALGTNVVAYVPNGSWGSSNLGVQAVPLEGAPNPPTSISTAHSVNSCSSNAATGETVCTANNTDVYLINGTSLTTTLTSGLSGSASFSGGSCTNCGVAVNALTNTAYIQGGLLGSPSGDGIQGLDLGTNTFATPFPTATIVSENISIDPGRNLILSPNENEVYDLLQLSPSGAITGEFELSGIGGGGEYDSAAEDCTTGIALSADEFTSNIILADLAQASFTPGSPGTWTAPNNVFTFNGSFAAGTSGISVAPGGSHLGIVTGEFGGQAFAVFQLPATAGTGGAIPTVVDYVYVPSLPNTPDGRSFSAGFDPHTITAYTSPNSGKALGVIADWATGTPSFLAVLDLQMLMAAPRVSGTNTINPSFNLLTSGALRYVATH